MLKRFSSKQLQKTFRRYSDLVKKCAENTEKTTSLILDSFREYNDGALEIIFSHEYSSISEESISSFYNSLSFVFMEGNKDGSAIRNLFPERKINDNRILVLI